MLFLRRLIERLANWALKELESREVSNQTIAPHYQQYSTVRWRDRIKHQQRGVIRRKR